MFGIKIVYIVVKLIYYFCEEIFIIRWFDCFYKVLLKGPFKGETFCETISSLWKVSCFCDEDFGLLVYEVIEVFKILLCQAQSAQLLEDSFDFLRLVAGLLTACTPFLDMVSNIFIEL